MNLIKGKLVLGDYSDLENPLDCLPLSKRLGQYNEWKEGERTSYRAIYVDRYLCVEGQVYGYESMELKISNRGKCFLDGKELKKSDDISTVKEIFSQLKVV